MAQSNKLIWRIRVTFAGNLQPKDYITPDIRHTDPGWGSELFNRAIEKIVFFLPTGRRLVMAGMEQYNFFVEAVQSFGKQARGKVEIKAFFFCGKIPGQNIVEMWRIGDNKVVRDRKPWGSEWGGGPTRGWKKGIASSNYISRVVL